MSVLARNANLALRVLRVYVPDALGGICFAWERITSTIRFSTLHRRYLEVATLPLLLGLLIVINLVLLLWLFLYQRSRPSQVVGLEVLVERSNGLQKALTEQFSLATADMAFPRSSS